MNGPEPFRPSVSYARSLSNGACLGACTGSLYLSILVAFINPVHKLIAFSAALVVATALTLPFLFWLSLILAPLLDGLLMKFHKGRLPLFTFAGGITGLVLFLILIALWFLWRRPDVWPDRDEILVLAILSTIPFCYGAAWGAFTALAMGRCDNRYMR